MDCAKISSFLRPGGVCLSLRLHSIFYPHSLVAILALSHSPPDREHNYFVIRIARTHAPTCVSHKIPAFKSPPPESSLPNANSARQHTVRAAALRDTIKIEREIGRENIAYEIDLHLFGEPQHVKVFSSEMWTLEAAQIGLRSENINILRNSKRDWSHQENCWSGGASVIKVLTTYNFCRHGWNCLCTRRIINKSGENADKD